MDQFYQVNIGQIFQVAIMLIGIGAMYAGIKNDIINQNKRLEKIEEEISDFRKAFILNVRIEEKMLALADIVRSQGKRLDNLAERVHGGRTDP